MPPWDFKIPARELDKNVIVSFRFTVANESRLLVVLQF